MKKVLTIALLLTSCVTLNACSNDNKNIPISAIDKKKAEYKIEIPEKNYSTVEELVQDSTQILIGKTGTAAFDRTVDGNINVINGQEGFDITQKLYGDVSSSIMLTTSYGKKENINKASESPVSQNGEYFQNLRLDEDKEYLIFVKEHQVPNDNELMYIPINGDQYIFEKTKSNEFVIRDSNNTITPERLTAEETKEMIKRIKQ